MTRRGREVAAGHCPSGGSPSPTTRAPTPSSPTLLDAPSMKSSPITSLPHDAMGMTLAATSCSDASRLLLLPYNYLMGPRFCFAVKEITASPILDEKREWPETLFLRQSTQRASRMDL